MCVYFVEMDKRCANLCNIQASIALILVFSFRKVLLENPNRKNVPLASFPLQQLRVSPERYLKVLPTMANHFQPYLVPFVNLPDSVAFSTHINPYIDIYAVCILCHPLKTLSIVFYFVVKGKGDFILVLSHLPQHFTNDVPYLIL